MIITLFQDVCHPVITLATLIQKKDWILHKKKKNGDKMNGGMFISLMNVKFIARKVEKN